MGKTVPTDDRVHVQLIEFGGHRFVIMEEEQYELLLDAIDVADAERILNDPNERSIPWEEARKEFLRTPSRKRGKSPAARKKGSRRSSASKSRQHTVGKSRARS